MCHYDYRYKVTMQFKIQCQINLNKLNFFLYYHGMSPKNLKTHFFKAGKVLKCSILLCILLRKCKFAFLYLKVKLNHKNCRVLGFILSPVSLEIRIKIFLFCISPFLAEIWYSWILCFQKKFKIISKSFVFFE